MQSRKKWLLAVLVVMVLGGSVMVIGLNSSRAVAAEEKASGDHWRNFDGHWSYWHEGDKRWYYTDGTHWYYHNGVGWVVYQFDKLFGAVGFHRGDYRIPGEKAKIELPSHGVYKNR
jgi:hypothetical protein